MRPWPRRRRRKRTERGHPKRWKKRRRRKRKTRISHPPGRANGRASQKVGISPWVACPCGFGACPPSPFCCVSGGGRTGAGSLERTPKKTKLEPYSLTAQQKGLIKEDQSNTKLWTEILKSLKDGPVSTLYGLGGLPPSFLFIATKQR